MNTCALCHLILTVTPWGIREDTEAQSGYVTWMSIQPVNCWVSFEPTWPLSDPPTATGSHWQAFPGLPLAGAESPWYTLVASLWTVINTLWLTREGGDFFFSPRKILYLGVSPSWVFQLTPWRFIYHFELWSGFTLFLHSPDRLFW